MRRKLEKKLKVLAVGIGCLFCFFLHFLFVYNILFPIFIYLYFIHLVFLFLIPRIRRCRRLTRTSLPSSFHLAQVGFLSLQGALRGSKFRYFAREKVGQVLSALELAGKDKVIDFLRKK